MCYDDMISRFHEDVRLRVWLSIAFFSFNLSSCIDLQAINSVCVFSFASDQSDDIMSDMAFLMCAYI
jgi:hypothetical protein